MALKGNLSDFSLTQLLNLINLAKKTGSLEIEGRDESAQVSFRGGKLAYAQMDQQVDGLAPILYKDKKLNKSQYRLIQEKSRQMGDKALGLYLINANYLDQQEILASLEKRTLNLVKELFTWAEGFFRFKNDLLPPEDKILVRLNLENLILEGTRQEREWEHLQDEIPSLEMALKFVDRPGANIRDVDLNKEEWSIVSYINPENSIRKIAKATKLSDLEIRRVIYSLLQAGLVELIRPEGAIPISTSSRLNLPEGSLEEHKSLVNRIIERIRSI